MEGWWGCKVSSAYASRYVLLSLKPIGIDINVITHDKFDGKEIEISGFYYEQFENVAISLNRDSSRHGELT